MILCTTPAAEAPRSAPPVPYSPEARCLHPGGNKLLQATEVSFNSEGNSSWQYFDRWSCQIPA
eukprot:1363033-Karenia_brevis.AAC.1